MAHKKGGGSTKNGRDSQSKRLGTKIYGDQPAKAGAIIVRQRGSKIHAGENAGIGRDYTIYALKAGMVYFQRINKRKIKVCVRSAAASASA